MPRPRHQIHDGAGEAAVDDDLVAVDVGCPIAGKKQDGVGHVLRRADAAHRHDGGAALVEPIDGQPEDDQLVCVVLAEQTDPDSQSSRSVRRWAPERDLTGARLGLRLTTDGSVEPLTVRVPERLIVLGKVIDWARPTDPQLKGRMR